MSWTTFSRVGFPFYALFTPNCVKSLKRNNILDSHLLKDLWLFGFKMLTANIPIKQQFTKYSILLTSQKIGMIPNYWTPNNQMEGRRPSQAALWLHNIIQRHQIFQYQSHPHHLPHKISTLHVSLSRTTLLQQCKACEESD